MARPYSTPDVFRAIAHPVRREILFTLKKKGELTAGALARPLPMSTASASQHIQILRLAGLIAARRRGRELHYRLNMPQLKQAGKWFRDIERE